MYEVLILPVSAVLIFFVTFLAFVLLDGDHCLQNQPGSVRYPQQSLPVQQFADAAASFAAVRGHSIPAMAVEYGLRRSRRRHHHTLARRPGGSAAAGITRPSA